MAIRPLKGINTFRSRFLRNQSRLKPYKLGFLDSALTYLSPSGIFCRKGWLLLQTFLLPDAICHPYADRKPSPDRRDCWKETFNLPN